MSSKIKALFIDRDGTIIKEKPGVYLCDPKKVELYKNTKAAFKLFKELGYTIFIVSNQSGIGRGYFTEREVKAVHKKLIALLKPYEVKEIVFCPHAPSQNCSCRKPAPAMGLKLIKKYNVDKDNSFVIGDKKSDIDFASNLNMRAVMVLTANGKKQQKKYAKDLKNVKICLDLLGAAKYIKKLQRGF
ncbi:MAG: HAD family hydrolase [Elusimicrobiaceae bacterium]|nr:HAD family hydrolase [Elusimicrobiaceae bacterium]